MQLHAAHGDRSRVDRLQVQHAITAASLSLKARETASLSLKRIFEQQIMISEAAARSSSGAPHRHQVSALQGSDGDQQHAGPALSTAAHHINSQRQVLQDQLHASADGIDLELRLAAPFTSVSHKAREETVQIIQHPENPSVNEAAGKAQLTIFYAGKVCVYEDVPAEKVKAVMLLAAESGERYRNVARKSRPVTPASSSDILCRPAKTVSRSHAELPFARKASLTRFFEKRKERLEARSGEYSDESGNPTLTATSEAESEAPRKRPCTSKNQPSCDMWTNQM